MPDNLIPQQNSESASSYQSVQQTGHTNLNVTNQDGGVINFYTGGRTNDHDADGNRLTSVTPTRYDANTRTIYLESEQITLPVQLIPQSLLNQEEMAYINALCEVYAEKLEQAVTPDTISTLPKSIQRNYAEQRKAFYAAESVHRSVREVYADGEVQFDLLKQDAYDGIEATYYKDTFSSGYERLNAVLEKITNTTLSKSTLMLIRGLIGNLEKKGICHILVNDETIKSWVNIDE